MERESKPRTTAAWRVRQYQEADRESLLRLSASHYGERDQARPEYLDWLASGGPAEPTMITVAEKVDSGEIVGFAFYIPLEVSFDGTCERCHLGCNLLVHPRYRGQGIYAAFNELFRKEGIESLFSYGFPKPAAMIPHRMMGKFPVSRIPLLVRPLDMPRLTAERIGNPLMRAALNLGWPIAGSTLWRSQSGGSDRDGINVLAKSEFDEKFDHFWAKHQQKYAIAIQRDRSFLNWRFSAPAFRSYEILAANAGDEMIGYAVIRCAEISGTETGLVMDLLVEPGRQGDQAGLRLIAEATRRFKDSGMAMAACLMLDHTQEYRILRRAGYIDAPERFSPQRFHLSTTSLSTRAPMEFLAQHDNWFITLANHDAV